MKHLFLLAIVAMITVKISFIHFHSSKCQRKIFLHQNTKLYLVSIAKGKDPSIRFKMHETYFLFLPLFVLYLLSGWDLFNVLNLLDG